MQDTAAGGGGLSQRPPRVAQPQDAPHQDVAPRPGLSRRCTEPRAHRESPCGDCRDQDTGLLLSMACLACCGHQGDQHCQVNTCSHSPGPRRPGEGAAELQQGEEDGNRSPEQRPRGSTWAQALDLSHQLLAPSQ